MKRDLFPILCVALAASTSACDAWSHESRANAPIAEQQSDGFARVEHLLDAYEGDPSSLEIAQRTIEMELSKNADNPRALEAEGRLYIKKAMVASMVYDPATIAIAIMSLEHAIRVEPNRTSAHIQLAYAYIYSSKEKQAQEQLMMAEALDSQDPSVDIAYAIAFEFTNRWQEFESRLASAEKKAAAQSPPATRISRRLAQLHLDNHLRLEDVAAATVDYQQLLRLSPNSAWAHGNYASHLLRRLGRTDEAMREASAAINLMPYGNATHTLGLAHYAKWSSLRTTDPIRAAEHRSKAEHYYPDKVAAMGEALAAPDTNADLKALAIALKSEGVSIDATDRNGDSALIRAVNTDDVGKMNSLLDAGADPNQLDFMKRTPVQLAIFKRSQPLLDGLIAHHADLELGDEFGRHPLHLAVLVNEVDMAHFLIAHKADVNARGFQEWTPLMVAAQQKDSLPMVKMLVESGADASFVAAGATAAELADRAGNADVAQWLSLRTGKAH